MPVEETAASQGGFAWRGLSLDVVRHFFTVEDVIRVMDIAQSVGLNRMHLHLSDDQGWRLDIPGWPELVERSSGSGVGGGPGGFYSRADWDRLKDAAGRRGLVLIPEIDLPGHSNAALHAVPGLNPDGATPPEYHGIEVGFSSLRLAAPDTQRFIRDVYAHLVDISEGLVHIGGDESHATDAAEYGELLDMIVAAVHDAGGTVIAWQEAAAHLHEGDYVQVWDPRLATAPVVAAAKRGVKVILSPASRVDLDMKYAESHDLGLTWMGTTELDRTARLDPAALIEGLDPAAIAGIEAALWTETLATFEEVSYMLLPRLAAVGEIAGTGRLDWESFADRLPAMAEVWRERGWPWHRSPGIAWR
ncbi:MAG TPA: family 20 glycosylhydrolase [Arachnia sp.]|nr:family 20 glycosylhydrolase [Arachnia sp.]